ncbi:MAG TPA: hypothetical protein VK691_03055 [Solirubrobacteraceae bacterium]|nr:hypothetical protein [Solirubrobacteraceae bacterium]
MAQQEGRAVHRQRTETIEDALAEVGRHRGRWADDPERERLHEDAADQVIAVVAARNGDYAAEDEREQQHEHQPAALRHALA